MEPGSSVCPDIVGGPNGHTHCLGDFAHVQAHEEPQFDEIGSRRIDFGQMIEKFVHGEQFFDRVARGDFRSVQLFALCFAAPLGRLSPSRLIDQNPPHGFPRGREEMSTAVPLLPV